MVVVVHISENIQKIITVKNVPRLLKSLIAGHDPVQQWHALAQVSSTLPFLVGRRKPITFLQFLSACILVRDLIGNLMGGKDVAILQKVGPALSLRLVAVLMKVILEQLCESFEVGLFAELNDMIDTKVGVSCVGNSSQGTQSSDMCRSIGQSRRTITESAFKKVLIRGSTTTGEHTMASLPCWYERISSIRADPIALTFPMAITVEDCSAHLQKHSSRLLSVSQRDLLSPARLPVCRPPSRGVPKSRHGSGYPCRLAIPVQY